MTKKKLIGEIVSDKLKNVRTVSVEKNKKIKKYQKSISFNTKYTAIDNKNLSKNQDLVEISQIKPKSRKIRWQITKVIKKA